MAFWGHTDIYEIELASCDAGAATTIDYTFYFGSTMPATAPPDAILDDGTGFASGREQGLSYVSAAAPFASSFEGAQKAAAQGWNCDGDPNVDYSGKPNADC